MSNQKPPCLCPASNAVSTADSQSNKNSQLVSNHNECSNKSEHLAKNDSQIQAVLSKTNNNNESLEKGKSSDGQDCTEMFEDKTCLKTIKEKFAEFYALEYQKHMKQENQDSMHKKEDNNYCQQENLQIDKEQSNNREKLNRDEQEIKNNVNQSNDHKYFKQEIQQYNEHGNTKKEELIDDRNYCDKNHQSDELETLICSCLEQLKSEQDNQKMLPNAQSKSLCSQTKTHEIPKYDLQEKYNDKQDRFKCLPDEENSQIQKHDKLKENGSKISAQSKSHPCTQQSEKQEQLKCDDEQKPETNLNTTKSNESQPCKQHSKKSEPLKCDDTEKLGSIQSVAKSNESKPCKPQPKKREPLKCDDKQKLGSNHTTAKSNESKPCRQQSDKGIPLKSDDKEKIGSNQNTTKSYENCIKECMRKISSTVSKTYKGVEGCLSSIKNSDSKSKSAASVTNKSKSSKSSTSTKTTYSYKSAESSDSEDNLRTKKYLPPNNKNIIVSRAQQKFYEFEAKPIKKCKSKETTSSRCVIT